MSEDQETGQRYQSTLDKVLSLDKVFLLVDTDREYLARLFHRMGFTTGAEIGVGGGVYSEMICKCVPGVKLYCVDLWKPYEGYSDFTDEKHLEHDYQITVDKLKDYDAHIIRKFSMDAVRDFEDGSLDFVYIDANHYSPWIDTDIEWWGRKVRSGGIISGHDYMYGHMEVVHAVDRLCQRPLFLVGKWNECGEAMMIPSWFWVKP